MTKNPPVSSVKIWWHMNLWNSKRESALLMNLTVFALQVKALSCSLLSHVSEEIE